ncbi:MAG TPA: NHL repeat-containing protein [bacterium]
MRRHSSGQWVLVCMIGLLAVLSSGCGTTNNATPSSPAAPTPTPTFNYSLDIFFGSSGPATLNNPTGIRLLGGTLWISNYTTSNVEAWTTTGVLSKAVTSFNGGPFGNPYGIGVGPDGYFYEADYNSSQAVELDAFGQYVTVFGSAQMGTDGPKGIAVNSTYAYLLDYTNPQIIRYTIGGSGATKTFTAPTTFGTLATSGSSGILTNPGNIALDGQGMVYVTDQNKPAIMKYNSSGVFQGAVTSTGLAYPEDVQVDGAGYQYVADYTAHNIQVFNPSGGAVTHIGDTILVGPTGLCLDPAGNIYVTDRGLREVIVFKKQ